MLGLRSTSMRSASDGSRVTARSALNPEVSPLLEEVLVEMLERRRREAAPTTPTADRARRSYFLDMPGAGLSGPYQEGDDL